jgi:Ca2+-binding RTX toxin-like protein
MPDGTPGDDTFVGTDEDEFFSVFQGGNDTISGNGGDDVAEFGFTFNFNDRFNGGKGHDHLWIHASAGPWHFTREIVKSVEEFTFQDGAYNVTFSDGMVAAEETTQVTFFNNSGTSTFDGHRETNGNFLLLGTNTGDIDFTAGHGDDQFAVDFEEGTSHFLDGRQGDDIVDLFNSALAGVTIDLEVTGFQEVASGKFASLLNIEGISGTISADVLGGTDGANTFFAGSGNDQVFARAGADMISGSGGVDILYGGAGADTFRYALVSHSTAAVRDVLADFNGRKDGFLLTVAITGVDPRIVGGNVSTASFDADLAAAVDAGLGASHAIVLRIDAGDLAGTKLLVVDNNGSGAYEAGSDLVMDVTSARGLHALDPASFASI